MFAQPILTAAAASKTARHILIGASSWAAAPGDFRRAGAYTAPASRGNRAAGDRERGSDFAGQLRSVRGQLHSWLAGGSSSAQAGWTECYCRRKSARHRSVEIARRKQYAGRLAEGEIPILLSQGADDKLVRPQVTKDYVAHLCRAGSNVRMVVLPGINHGFIQPRQRQRGGRLDGGSVRGRCRAERLPDAIGCGAQ
jgi:pimeloyl-ACP methyl ester carboxylesterase